MISVVFIQFLVLTILVSIVDADMNSIWADSLVASIDFDQPLSFEYDPVNRELNVVSHDSDIQNNTEASWWGCMREITKPCTDMTNASSTWVGIVVGGAIGAFITWLVYFLQKKTTIKQDQSIERLEELDKRHDSILKLMQQFQKHQEKLLEQILSLNKKIDSSIEKNKGTK